MTGTLTTPVRHHGILHRSLLFPLRLTCATGLHIGGGSRPDFLDSDQPVIRDGSGQPMIPGSSLRGVLRSACESLIGGLALDDWSPSVSGENGCSDEMRATWNKLGVLHRIFGTDPKVHPEDFYASRLKVSDLLCKSQDVEVELRDGVGIDRETRTAANRVKYDIEVVPAGTIFEGRIRWENPDDFEIGLLAQSLWMLGEGMIQLGGGSARGLGWMEVAVGPVTEWTAEEILAAAEAEAASEESGPDSSDSDPRPGDKSGDAASWSSVQARLGSYLEAFRRTVEAARAERKGG
ncbi:MAG: RAMP superfamily CRISPR-associated protein [Acidobacteriota bacterium]|nr:RAMP superfamily CRISPR-associated protein [Acidobacteriota bacterium]